MAESSQDSELTLEARIVTNAEQVAKEIGDMMDSAAKSGQKAARAIKQEFANITPQRGFLDAGRAIIKMSEQMGQSIEKTVDTIKEQNRGLERTKEELLFAARAAKEFEENVKRIGIDDMATRNVASTMLQNAGISPVGLDPALYEEQLTQMQERLNLMGQESETVAELQGKVEAYNEQLQNSVDITKLANQVVDDVDAAWTEMGVLMPKEQAVAFADSINEVIKQLDDQKISAEDAAKALAQMRGEYIQMGQAQAAQEQGQKKGGGGILESVTGGQTKGLGQMLLGGATKMLTGVIAGFGIAKIAGEIQKVLKQSIALGNQAEVQQVNLTIAVREHQRAVGELSPTIAEANRWTQELSDKYLMTQNEAEGLVSQTLLLTKDLRLSADETKNVAEQAAVLGQVFQRDVGSTLRTLTEALNTGRTEGLDAYGIALDATTLKAEAVRRGLMSAGDELDIYTKRQVIAAVLEEKVAGLREDSAAQLETTAAKLAASQEKLDETKETLGKLLTPFQEFYELLKDKVATTALQLLILGMIEFGEATATVTGKMQGFMDTFDEFMAKAGGGVKGLISALAAIPTAGFQARREENQQARIEENTKALYDSMNDLLNPGRELGDVGGEAFAENIQKAFDEVTVITEDNMKQLTDRTRELYDEYNQTIMDIMADFAKRRAELEASYRQDVADAEADYQRRKKEEQVQFNRAEKREAEDHKIEMRRLEEDYLMELDDLVRERDAKGVLMAQRRYNVEKRRREEDFDLAKKRRGEDFQYEQRQLEYQRALRLQQMKRDYEERQAALAEQERDALQRASEAFQRQIELERKAAEESLRTILEAAKERLNLSQQELKALHDMLVAAQPAFRNLWNGIYGAGSSPQPVGTSGMGVAGAGGANRGFQRGGSFFAVGPTSAMFGEGGPERVDVTPLSASTGQARPGFGGGAGGANGRMQIELDVKADPMFMVEVSEKTMSDVADVVVRLTKAETGGLR